MSDVLICDDCMLFIANGELPPDSSPDRDQEIELGSSILDATYRFGSVGNEYGFSAKSCASCGDTLAGNRHIYNHAGLYDIVNS